MVEDLKDTRRSEPDYDLGERAMLEAWLEFHRTTLLLKCEGLTDEQRKRRAVVTSLLSLHGLVRHMAEVERSWFTRVLLTAPETPHFFYTGGEEEDDLVPLDGAIWEDDLATWQEACATSRANAAGRGLDATGTTRSGASCSLRWIYTHMIEEYARHNGHADLLRELVDGTVGW
jgi:uncharacterized damage-inducible protein DinB